MNSVSVAVKSVLSSKFKFRTFCSFWQNRSCRAMVIVNSSEVNNNLVCPKSSIMDSKIKSATICSSPPAMTTTLSTSQSSLPEESGPSEILKLMWRVNSFLMQDFRSSDGGACIPLLVGYRQVGLLSSKVVGILSRYPAIFIVTSTAVILNQQLCTFKSRSAAMAEVLEDIRKRKETIALRSWRDELFTVWGHYGTEPLFEIERAAVALLGIRSFGVHITGYVRNLDDSIAGIWLQKRADNKPTYPGMLDTMVGGLITAGLSASQTAVKESAEEASIPPHIIEKLKPVGTVSFFTETERGLHANTEHVYDLELPPNHTPTSCDGEVQDFIFVETKDILSYLLHPNYKLTSTPILADFLIRHGIINSDLIPDFPEVVEMLHVSLNLHYRMWPKRSLSDPTCSIPTVCLPVTSAKVSETDESDSSSVSTEDSAIYRLESMSIGRMDSREDEIYY